MNGMHLRAQVPKQKDIAQAHYFLEKEDNQGERNEKFKAWPTRKKVSLQSKQMEK